MWEIAYCRNSCTALLPNLPNDEQSEEGQSLMARGGALGHKRPSFSNVEVSPL
jgi:hypothetical protein